MSPELINIMNGIGTGEFNPELSDIYDHLIKEDGSIEKAL